MPNKKKSHSDVQKLICLMCCRKQKNVREISDRFLPSVKEHIKCDYGEKEWDWLPSVICLSCLPQLQKREKNPEHPLKVCDFEALTPPQYWRQGVVTRANQDENCTCSLCQVWRLIGQDAIKYNLSIKPLPGRPRESPEPSREIVCTLCLSVLGKGKSHICTRKGKKNNVKDMIRSSSPRSKKQIVSSQVKEILVEEGVKRGEETTLMTEGPSLTVSIGKQNPDRPQPTFSIRDMTRLQTSVNLTDNQVKEVGHMLRSKGGRKCVERNLGENLTKRNHSLDHLFYHDKIEIDIKKSKKEKQTQKYKKEKGELYERVQRPAVVVKKLETIVSHLISERGLESQASTVQVGLDNGQDLLKMTLTVKDSDNLPKSQKK